MSIAQFSRASAFVTLDAADNVAVAVRRVAAGEIFDDVTARDEIPKGHKIARSDIAAGEAIRKYAQVIGYAEAPIAAGSHLHVHNVVFRNTEHNYDFCVDRKDVEALPASEQATFQGFRRPNGKVGTRNYIGVLTSVNCSATAARHTAQTY